MMTQGERMIWAAAYALALKRSDERAVHQRDNDRRREVELGGAVSAAEVAWYAVDRLREVQDDIREAFFDDDVFHMAADMLAEEENDE